MTMNIEYMKNDKSMKTNICVRLFYESHFIRRISFDPYSSYLDYLAQLLFGPYFCLSPTPYHFFMKTLSLFIYKLLFLAYNYIIFITSYIKLVDDVIYLKVESSTKTIIIVLKDCETPTIKIYIYIKNDHHFS